MADFLDAKLKEIDERLKELKPLVEEYRRLEAARNAMSGATPVADSPSTPRRRGPGRPKGSGTRRRGRPRGGNTRAKQALELIRSQPGITIRELAAAMSIQPNYLYRVLPQMEKDGEVSRQGQGWHAAG
jgi:MarR family